MSPQASPTGTPRAGAVLPGNTDRGSPQLPPHFPGEPFDKEAGLSHLNARYYDPKLAFLRKTVPQTVFPASLLQPDWFEVAKQGVGPNRYAYSHNDPVNKLDPGGNESYLVSRDLNSAFLPVGAHSFFAIIVSDIAAKSYSSEMRSNFVSMKNDSGAIPGIDKGASFSVVTIGGHNGDEDVNGHPDGKLVSIMNEEADLKAIQEIADGRTDIGGFNADIGAALTSKSIESGRNIDQSLFDTVKSYDNTLSYGAFANGNSYNCHGLSRAAADILGLSNFPTKISGYTPGQHKAVPKENFRSNPDSNKSKDRKEEKRESRRR